jgi:hypothetical protein
MERTMFVITPVVILILALTAGTAATIDESQDTATVCVEKSEARDEATVDTRLESCTPAPGPATAEDEVVTSTARVFPTEQAVDRNL